MSESECDCIDACASVYACSRIYVRYMNAVNVYMNSHTMKSLHTYACMYVRMND